MSSKSNPGRPAAIDPLVAQRLEALSRRQGQPLPPPAAAGPAASAARTTSATAAGAASRSGRRAKPARKAKATALAVSVVSTGAMAALFAQQDTSSDSVVLTSGTLAPVASPGTATVVSAPSVVTTPIITTVQPATTPATQAPVTSAPATQAPVQAGIADGTYVGQGSRNRWGTVQVQAVYSGGQLTDVQVLNYPNGDRRSLRISQYSLPRLVDQALSAQGTAIAGISGATYTSRSYVASLQSAIDAAKAASGISG